MPATRLVVTSVRSLSPALVRIDFRSDDLSAFIGSEDTDRYVKLVFAPAGVSYPEPFDMAQVRATYAPEQQPVIRTYTALEPDPDAGTLAIDFVVHGDAGVAGPWAAQAQPGDTLLANGPGGGYAPSAEADWHLLAGDEAGLPAIMAAVAALPTDAVGEVVVEIEGSGSEVAFPTPQGVTVTWVHRGSATHAAAGAAEEAPPALLEAVRSVRWREGRVQAFVHGEGQVVMRGIRPWLLQEKKVPREDVSISGYWRRGRTEEGFRTWKRELASVEA